MARISRTKKTLVVAAALALTIGGAGAAFAYWTAGGTGDGTATTGETAGFTVTVAAAAGPAIAPGNAGQTISFTVDNEGANIQHLTLVEVSIEGLDGDGEPWAPPAGCDIDDFVATLTTPPVYADIAPGASLPGMATVTLTNTAVNQDACQGIVDEVPLHIVAS